MQARAARAPARPRARRRGPAAPRGTPPAPPPGGRPGTARASAAGAAPRAAGARRPARPARRPPPRGVRRRGRRRSPCRARRAALLEPPRPRRAANGLGDIGERQGRARAPAPRGARRRRQPLEALRVALVVADSQCVAVPVRDDLALAAGRGERLAQLRDVDLERLRGGGRAAPRPRGPRSAGRPTPSRRRGGPAWRAGRAAFRRPARSGAHRRRPRRVPGHERASERRSR